MNDDNLITAQDMIMLSMTNIDRAEIEKNNKLLKTWRETLESIKSNAVNGKNLGSNLYAHTRIIDFKNGILLIEADHPGWIQTLKIYQNYIIKGLRMGVKDIKVVSLSFRLKGTNVELHSQINEENIKENIKKRIENEEKIISEFDEKNKRENNDEKIETKKEIPENLKKILDRLKNDMLTNEE